MGEVEDEPEKHDEACWHGQAEGVEDALEMEVEEEVLQCPDVRVEVVGEQMSEL